MQRATKPTFPSTRWLSLGGGRENDIDLRKSRTPRSRRQRDAEPRRRISSPRCGGGGGRDGWSRLRQRIRQGKRNSCKTESISLSFVCRQLPADSSHVPPPQLQTKTLSVCLANNQKCDCFDNLTMNAEKGDVCVEVSGRHSIAQPPRGCWFTPRPLGLSSASSLSWVPCRGAPLRFHLNSGEFGSDLICT